MCRRETADIAILRKIMYNQIMKKYFFLLPFILIFASAGPTPPKAPPPPEGLVLTFVGDLMANPLMVDLLSRSPLALMPVKPYLNGDLNFANLEFTVDASKPPMGYPRFNGTRDYLRTFRDYFNIVSVANNHTYDQGAKSQAETLGYLMEDGVLFVGGSIHAPYSPALRTNIGGIDLFFNAYTLVDNGLSAGATNTEYRYYMNFYPTGAAAAKALEKELEDVPAETLKIASLHFGAEYKAQPTEAEKMHAKMLIEAGADIVVGHHPHCPRPAEWYEGKRHSGVILYSLGNFYTPHKNSYAYLDAGTVVRLKVSPQKDYHFSYMPTFTYFFESTAGRISRVLPLEKDPSISPPLSKEFAISYPYTERDRLNMKDAYTVVHQFYTPLLSISKGLNSKPLK